jgi:hypothetical protein
MLQFNDMGLLIPTQPIKSDINEFQVNFVFNDHRERLFTIFQAFLEDLDKLEMGNYFQWIDGSFTTKKTFPSDIDLVCFVHFQIYKSKKTRFLELKQLYKKRGIDAYFAEYYPENHPLEPTNQYQFNDWLDVYGASKPIGQQKKIFKKGFISIQF